MLKVFMGRFGSLESRGPTVTSEFERFIHRMVTEQGDIPESSVRTGKEAKHKKKGELSTEELEERLKKGEDMRFGVVRLGPPQSKRESTSSNRFVRRSNSA